MMEQYLPRHAVSDQGTDHEDTIETLFIWQHELTEHGHTPCEKAAKHSVRLR